MPQFPRHTRVNRHQWIRANERFAAAMADGRVDPCERAEIEDILDGGQDISAVLDAGDALSQAVERSRDPEYVTGLTMVYAALVERLPPPSAAA